MNTRAKRSPNDGDAEVEANSAPADGVNKGKAIAGATSAKTANEDRGHENPGAGEPGNRKKRKVEAEATREDPAGEKMIDGTMILVKRPKVKEES